MIQATARVLQNVVELKVGPENWTGRPVTTMTGPVTRRLAALFSTVYETHRAVDADGRVHSTVSYHPKKDEIWVQIGEDKWRTTSSVFGPMTFEYGGLLYALHEKLTGRFGIFRGERVVAQGELGFRSCVIREYPTELEGYLANFSLGYLVRTLFWQMLR
jgi:hypothetical protein